MKDLYVYRQRTNIQLSVFLSLLYFMVMLPEFRSIFYWRIGKWCKLFFWWFPGRSNLYLHTPSSRVGGGLYVGHGWGTILNAHSIGDNFLIGQNCTVGSRNCKEPIIGNNVCVWAHCLVLGDIQIGDNTQIGAGSVVVNDIPDNCVVAPVKSSIIKLNNERVNIYL